MDRRIASDFTVISTLFQSYRADARVIKKDYVQGIPVYGLKDSASSGIQTMAPSLAS